MAHVTEVDPDLTYVLAEGLPVAGIRYAQSHPKGTPARFQLS